MSRRWIYFRIIHILLDILGIYAAFLLAYFVRVGWIFSTDFTFTTFSLLSLLAALAWSGFLLLAKYYRIPPRSESRVWFDVMLALLGGAMAAGLLIVLYFFPKEVLFSRLITVYGFLFGSAWLLVTQWLFRLFLQRAKKKQKENYRTLIIGANKIAEKLIHAIETNKYAPYSIVGVIDPYGLHKKIKGSQILGKLNKLEDVCEQEKITAIIQCDAFEHTVNLISLCDEKNIKFQFDPALRGIFEENLRIREVAGITMISFVQRDFSGTKKFRYRMIDWVLRQVFDID